MFNSLFNTLNPQKTRVIKNSESQPRHYTLDVLPPKIIQPSVKKTEGSGAFKSIAALCSGKTQPKEVLNLTKYDTLQQDAHMFAGKSQKVGSHKAQDSLLLQTVRKLDESMTLTENKIKDINKRLHPDTQAFKSESSELEDLQNRLALLEAGLTPEKVKKQAHYAEQADKIKKLKSDNSTNFQRMIKSGSALQARLAGMDLT